MDATANDYFEVAVTLKLAFGHTSIKKGIWM